jgi:hypothetical protein
MSSPNQKHWIFLGFGERNQNRQRDKERDKHRIIEGLKNKIRGRQREI